MGVEQLDKTTINMIITKMHLKFSYCTYINYDLKANEFGGVKKMAGCILNDDY